MKRWPIVLFLALSSASVFAQSLGEVGAAEAKRRGAAEKPKTVYTDADLPGSSAKPDATASTDKVGPGSGVAAQQAAPAKPDTDKDRVFLCKARSVKALFASVNAEHNGYFTETFAAAKLRDPVFGAAAKADTEGCENGHYVGAMEKALKAEADEIARLRGLLKGVF